MTRGQTDTALRFGRRQSVGSSAELSGKQGAFTLIELLVVISIIAVLAALTVGLTGVASRKGKESRIRADLNQLVTLIEGYSADFGAPPPDNPANPAINPLFYELSGTVYANGTFTVQGASESIATATIKQVFGRSGIGNAARDPRDLKFRHTFKLAQYKEVAPNVVGANANDDIELLASPVEGPQTTTYSNPLPNQNNEMTVNLKLQGKLGGFINPWLYNSSSPKRNNNNPNGFDLWTVVHLGGQVVRISNWESQPVVLGKKQ